MNGEISRIRLYSMRFFYLFNAIVIGFGMWPELFRHEKPFDLIHSVAFSLYAGYSLIMLLGVLLPVRMLPLLLLQLTYKAIWIATIGLPMWLVGNPRPVAGVVKFFAAIVVLDVLVIPWHYIFGSFWQKAAN
jgi:hypothetical protein